MKYLVTILIIFFFSCVTEKKAYRKVQEDTFVDAKQKQILLDKTLLLYPDLRDTPRIVNKYIDSTEYNATIAAYLDVIDQLNKQLANDTTQEYLLLTPEGNLVKTKCPVSKKDSLRIITQFLKSFHPPAIKEITEKETPTTDGRLINRVRDNLNACEGTNAMLNNKVDDLESKLSKRNNRTGWFIAGGVLAVIGSYFAGKFIKI